MTSTILPQIQIETPQMMVGEKSVDLSDHYPISMTVDGKKIISYNVQLMHTFLTKTKTTPEERQNTIDAIAAYFDKSGADLCCVQELFDNDANQALEKAMLRYGYHATKRLDRGTPVSMFNGGVRCFVRNIDDDFFETKMYFYEHKIDYLIGGDATANKGVEQISFRTEGKKFHVFNTHLQAYYPERDHYSEVALAQCIELKNMIEKQMEDGTIGPDDRVILCGDFNIPKPHSAEEETFFYTKMRHIMGQKFTLLDYADATQHTRSLTNTHNCDEPKSNDNDVNLDLGILYTPNKKHTSTELRLSEIYTNIQESMADFVEKKATLFSVWLLYDEHKAELLTFNTSFEKIMKQADTLLLKGKNPLESRRWRKEVEELRLNIHQANHKVTSTKRNVGGAAISASLLFFVPPAGILYAILSLAYFAIMIIFGLIQSRKPLKPLDLQTDRFFSHQQKPSKGQSPPMEPAAQPS